MAILSTPSQPVRTNLTYEEWLRLPEMKQRYEIIHGELIMSPSPTFGHQEFVFHIAKLLDSFVKANRLGIVVPAPLDVVIRKTPRLQTRQPDILYLNSERFRNYERAQLRQMKQLEIAPDLVVEILSPEDMRKGFAEKLADYAAIGVLEVWIVSPEAETVEILHLHEGKYDKAGLYGHGDTVQSGALPQYAIAVEALFAIE